jgi:hypothetical protein
MDYYYFPPKQNTQTSLRIEWASTQKVESILQATPNFTFSLLMNSSKSMQQVPSSYLFFSIYLPIYVTQTCTRGLVHGSPLLGDCNRQTLSICYPGSIERIKLLGVLYWLTDMVFHALGVYLSVFFLGHPTIEKFSIQNPM